ncbi:hypothetical protein LCGC14_1833360 [marine sediment metagenome]|uniref:Uncharacterized protein n=1 Tax=marine sediment metagenome TaxID=412755 RepID=A0A0F9GFJ7_9ZZZZ
MIDKMRATLIVVFMLAWVIIAGIHTWGKPHTPAIILFIPWYGWACLVVALVVAYVPFGKRNERDKNSHEGSRG